MSYFIKVFRETGGVAVVSEDISLPFVPCGVHLRICPTYASLQSGQISSYTPNSENLSGLEFKSERSFRIVLMVRNAILSSVFLKRLLT